jgi:hypothetical protein
MQVSGRWSMRFLWLSRDYVRIMPRPRGVSSCRWIQDLLFHVVLGVGRGRVEVLDHTHWAFVCFDVGPELHDAAASFCLREVARRLGHIPVRLLGGAIFVRVEFGFGVGGPEEGFGVLFDQVDDLVGDESVKNQRNEP